MPVLDPGPYIVSIDLFENIGSAWGKRRCETISLLLDGMATTPV